MIVAVIPARGGSKRIPRKNIKKFCGKPIMAWPLEACRASGLFDDVIVSTDDDEIAEIARRLGASVPFLRPAELADDKTHTTAVMGHALQWLQCERRSPKFVCCVYPTAPFVRAEDIKRGLDALEQTGCEYAFSVTSYTSPIQRALRITANGRVEMFHPEHFKTRSQDLEQAFHDAAQFYWGRAEAWLTGTPVFSQLAVPIIIERHRVQDIDTPEDWHRAELMFNAMWRQSDGMTQ